MNSSSSLPANRRRREGNVACGFSIGVSLERHFWRMPDNVESLSLEKLNESSSRPSHTTTFTTKPQNGTCTSFFNTSFRATKEQEFITPKLPPGTPSAAVVLWMGQDSHTLPGHGQGAARTMSHRGCSGDILTHCERESSLRCHLPFSSRWECQTLMC